MRQNLFIARREKGLTQLKTAEVINLSKQSYHLKESGKRDFSLTEAKMLAEFFNVSMDELFEK